MQYRLELAPHKIFAADQALGVCLPRLFDLALRSFDEETGTVGAVLSKGNLVRRIYSSERLQIAEGAIDLNRVVGGVVPLLDSYRVGHDHGECRSHHRRADRTRRHRRRRIGRPARVQ